MFMLILISCSSHLTFSICPNVVLSFSFIRIAATVADIIILNHFMDHNRCLHLNRLTYILQLILKTPLLLTSNNNMRKCSIDRLSDPTLLMMKPIFVGVFGSSIRFLWCTLFRRRVMISSRLPHIFVARGSLNLNRDSRRFFSFPPLPHQRHYGEWRQKTSTEEDKRLTVKSSLAFICLPQTNYLLYEC